MRLCAWTRATGMLVLLALIGGLAGCNPGYKARAVVKGQVTFDGKPLYSGTVMFVTKDNRSGTAPIDQNGNYTMNDAPIGDVAVTVTVLKMPGMAGKMATPGGGAAPMKAPDGSDPVGMAPKAPTMDPSKIVQIPEKYAKADTSGLTYKVEKGEQTFNITLTP